MSEFVWLVETSTLCDLPHVQRYQLERVTDHSVVVCIHGNRRRIVEAAGRRFFTDEEKMREFCKGWVTRRLENHRHAVTYLSSLVRSGEYPVEVVPCDIQPAGEILDDA